MTQQDCPICYEKIDNDINISISVCGHTFHTHCLLLCGSKCPMCRKNLITTNTVTTGTFTAGVYSHNEYKQLLEEKGISYDSLSPTTKDWLEECEEHDNLMTELEETRKKREENEKQTLKNSNPNKYKLLYGSKK